MLPNNTYYHQGALINKTKINKEVILLKQEIKELKQTINELSEKLNNVNKQSN